MAKSNTIQIKLVSTADKVFEGKGDGGVTLRARIPSRFWKVVVARVGDDEGRHRARYERRAGIVERPSKMRRHRRVGVEARDVPAAPQHLVREERRGGAHVEERRARAGLLEAQARAFGVEGSPNPSRNLVM